MSVVKSIKASIIFSLMLFVMTIFAGCKGDVTKDSLLGEFVSLVNPEVEKEEESVVPGMLYIVTADVTGITENLTVYVASEDYNGSEVVTTLSGSDILNDGTVRFERVIKADSEGRLLFHIKEVIDNSDNHGYNENEDEAEQLVEIRFGNVSAIPVEYSEKYKLLESSDGKIRIVFLREDVNESEISSTLLQQWVDKLSEFRTNLCDYVGGIEPSDTTDYIATEEFGYYALAGDPIYINRSFVAEDLARISISEEPSECTFLWEYVHEMSHTFDGIDSEKINGNWNFDSEFFATFKTVYAFAEMNIPMEAGAPLGEETVEYFKKNNTLKNGVYSSDGLVYTLITKLNQFDGKAFSHVKRAIRECRNETLSDNSDESKFALFLEKLEEETGVGLSDILTENEWEALYEKYMN